MPDPAPHESSAAINMNAGRRSSISSTSSQLSSKAVSNTPAVGSTDPSGSSNRQETDNSGSSNRQEAQQESEPSSKGKAVESLRRSQACLACRKRKLRCDAKKPTCSRCETAWRAHDASINAGDAPPPPCEYDTSLFSRLFNRPSSSDLQLSNVSGLEKSVSSQAHSDRAQMGKHELQADNDRLRARLALLEGDAYASSSLHDADPDAPPMFPRFREGDRLSKRSLHKLQDEYRISTSPQKRKTPTEAYPSSSRYPSSRRWSVLSSSQRDAQAIESQDNPLSTPSQTLGTSSKSTRVRTSDSVLPAAFGRISRPDDLFWARPPSPAQSATRLPPTPTRPDLPSIDVMLELAHAFSRSSWLASAFNAYALTDLPFILGSTASLGVERYYVEAILMALIAVSLPFCPLAVAPLANLLDKDPLSTASVFNSLGPIPMITNAYAAGARDLMHHVQTFRAPTDVYDALPVQLLLVEYASANGSSHDSHIELSQAIVKARLLDLHDAIPGLSPRYDHHIRSTSSPNLQRTLDSLMQAEQHVHSFWYLYVQDCFQSKLSGSPCLLDRESIRVSFPGRLESRSMQSVQENQSEVWAHLHSKVGCPKLEAFDDAYCLLIKSVMVLDACCDFSSRVRAVGLSTALAESRQGLDIGLEAINDQIRLLRIALRQFADRERPPSRTMDARIGRRHQHENQDLLLSDDLILFSADTTHHLCVLCLFGSLMDLQHPYEVSDSRDIVKTAAIWLSRLAESTLRPTSVAPISLAPVCSLAFFIAARWLVYLQIASPTEFQHDISTLVAALWTRANNCANDYLLAKAIVALARERDSFGRICLSPFTWPIDAISVFGPLSRSANSRTNKERMGDFTSSTTLQVLASTIEDAAVEKLVMHSAQY